MAEVHVLTAPESIDNVYGCSVFLAGGITNCPNWQNDVIQLIKENFDFYCPCDDRISYLCGDYRNLSDLYIYNPRRENFPIHDPSASEKQIKWEFEALEKADIFSMYFSSGESDQPICMYELGRNLCRMQNKGSNWKDRIVITTENGYRRKNDVVIQTKLATDIDVQLLYDDAKYEDFIFFHATHILSAYRKYVLFMDGLADKND